jgi:hypothetical protein
MFAVWSCKRWKVTPLLLSCCAVLAKNLRPTTVRRTGDFRLYERSKPRPQLIQFHDDAVVKIEKDKECQNKTV